MSLTHYAYIYTDPNNYESFYVGKGQKYRAYVHMQLNSKRTNKRLKSRILKILNQSKKPIITLIPTSSEELALMLEKGLIKIFGRKDLSKGTLYNFTDGGEGTTNIIRSEEAKRKTSEKLKGIKRGPMSLEHKQKMIESKKRNHIPKVWMHKGDLQTKVKLDNIEKYLSEGWVKGISGKHITEAYKKKLSIKTTQQWKRIKGELKLA
jgi:hypothetical protein